MCCPLDSILHSTFQFFWSFACLVLEYIYIYIYTYLLWGSFLLHICGFRHDFLCYLCFDSVVCSCEEFFLYQLIWYVAIRLSFQVFYTLVPGRTLEMPLCPLGVQNRPNLLPVPRGSVLQECLGRLSWYHMLAVKAFKECGSILHTKLKSSLSHLPQVYNHLGMFGVPGPIPAAMIEYLSKQKKLNSSLFERPGSPRCRHQQTWCLERACSS